MDKIFFKYSNHGLYGRPYTIHINHQHDHKLDIFTIVATDGDIVISAHRVPFHRVFEICKTSFYFTRRIRKRGNNTAFSHYTQYYYVKIANRGIISVFTV